MTSHCLRTLVLTVLAELEVALHFEISFEISGSVTDSVPFVLHRFVSTCRVQRHGNRSAREEHHPALQLWRDDRQTG